MRLKPARSNDQCVAGRLPSALQLTAVAVGLAACHAPPPERPYTSVIATRAIPAAVLSRYELAGPGRDVKPAVATLEREPLIEPPPAPAPEPAPPPPPLGPKTEASPPARETLAPPRVEERAATLPDDVVLRLLETGRTLFVRCFKKAVANDPLVSSFKVRVHVELDGSGAVTASSADATDEALRACVVRAAGWLHYPATGGRVVVELPLYYRAE